MPRAGDEHGRERRGRRPRRTGRWRGRAKRWRVMVGSCVAGLLGGERARHVRVDRADERIGAGREGRHVVDDDRRAGDDLAREHGRARRVVDRDVVRLARVLVVERDRERLAGRRLERRDRGTPCSVRSRWRRRRQARRGGGRSRAAAAGDRRWPTGRAPAAAPPSWAGCPSVSSRPPGEEPARGPRSVAIGHEGDGPASRCPVRSAATAARYSRTASISQPSSVTESATRARGSAPSRRRSGPATSSVIDIAMSSGRNDGAGMWTPAGGVPWGVGSAPGGGARARAQRLAAGGDQRGRRRRQVVVLAQELAAPVEQRDRRGRSRRSSSQRPPITSPKPEHQHAERAEQRGERSAGQVGSGRRHRGHPALAAARRARRREPVDRPGDVQEREDQQQDRDQARPASPSRGRRTAG